MEKLSETLRTTMIKILEEQLRLRKVTPAAEAEMTDLQYERYHTDLGWICRELMKLKNNGQ